MYNGIYVDSRQAPTPSGTYRMRRRDVRHAASIPFTLQRFLDVYKRQPLHEQMPLSVF